MLDTDVLICGSGGAGIRAAIAAAEQGVTTTLVTKGSYNRSGASLLIGGDVMVDGKSLHDFGYNGNPDDTPQRWFRDICIEGFYLNNQELVRNYVDTAPERIKELLDWGLKVKHADDREIITSGLQVMNALSREFRRHNIQLLQDTMLCELIQSKGKVIGAVGFDIHNSEFIPIRSKAVILATGGWMKAYPFNSITSGMSGDGQAMAYRAGAEVANMEMVTFCPDVMLYPKHFRGSLFFYIMHFTCGSLRNKNGEDILRNCNPKITDIAINTEWNKLLLSIYAAHEIRQGNGSPHGGVYFSIADVPWEKVDSCRTSGFAPNWKYKGEDFTEVVQQLKEGISPEVGPAAHYIEGGIRVDNQYQTKIKGLFAAGECKTGTFGANRVSAASTEMLVEGYLAGQNAANYAKTQSHQAIPEDILEETITRIEEPFKRKDGIRPQTLIRKLHEITDNYLNVLRTGEGLQIASQRTEFLRKKELPQLYIEDKHTRYNQEWIEALEVQNMVQIIEISAKSALLRTESRGVHHRLDYPRINHDRWLKEIVATSMGDNPQLTTHDVVVTDIPLPTGIVAFESAILNAVDLLKS